MFSGKLINHVSSVLFTLLAILCFSNFTLAQQKTYDIDSNRALSQKESIAPISYQEYGNYLFFVSSPSVAPNYYSPANPAYHPSQNVLWRYDIRNNSAIIIDSSEYGEYSYSIINDRVVYFDGIVLQSSNLSGTDTKELGTFEGYSIEFIWFDEQLFFTASEHNGETTLWKTDGKPEGSIRIDICQENTCATSPIAMVVSANKLFFIATSANNKKQIWSLNSQNELSAFIEIEVGDIDKLFPVPQGVIFNAKAESQLWYLNSIRSDAYPIGASSESIISLNDLIITVNNNQLNVIPDNGRGEAFSVQVKKDTRDKYFTGFVSDFILLNDRIYFIAEFQSNAGKQFDLMSFDGTANGLTKVYSFDGQVEKSKFMGTKGNKLILLLENSQADRLLTNEIWLSDGSGEGTVKLTSYGAPDSTRYSGKDLWELGAWAFVENDFFFSGFTIENGLELWRTDGTVSGTRIAKDIAHGQIKYQRGPIVSSGTDIYYTLMHQWYGTLDGWTGTHEELELWKTNTLNMESLKIDEGSHPNPSPKAIIPVEGGQFWLIRNEDRFYDINLFFYNYLDGEVSTVLSGVTDICSNTSTDYRTRSVVGKKLFFEVREDGESGDECRLWVSDGTSEGTFAVTDLLPEKNYSSTEFINLITHNNEVYFSMDITFSSDVSREFHDLRTIVYKSDGTREGTHEVFRLAVEDGSNSPNIGNIVSTPKGLFIHTYYIDSSSLWFWDGEQLTNVLKDVSSIASNQIVRLKQGISFILDDAIWISDGTVDGTYQVKKLTRQTNNKLLSTPNFEKLVYLDTPLYINGVPQFGQQVSVSDGTSEGTMIIGSYVESFVKIEHITESDVYLTLYNDLHHDFNQYSVRASLEGSETVSLSDKHVSSLDKMTMLNVQRKVIIGNEVTGTDYYNPGYGGPYITANLDEGDTDGDGIVNSEDDFPLHSYKFIDTDGDDIDNSLDIDDDGDGIEDLFDLFPLDASEWADNDQDTVGDNKDTDDDNDGVSDWLDSYPKDASKVSNPLPVYTEIPELTAPENPVDNGEKNSSGGTLNFYLLLIMVLFFYHRTEMFISKS